MTFAMGVAIAYLLGSLPAAYLAGRARGVDLGTVGSGNYGATNVYRNLGRGPAALVLLVDAGKGFVPAAFFGSLFAPGIEPTVAAIAFGLAAILGHVFSIFLRFRGGKGVGTAAGVFLALVPIATGIAALVWLAIVLSTRIVSLASLAAAFSLAAGVVVTADPGPGRTPLIGVTIVLMVFVVWTHRDNIGRLVRGEEARIRAASRRER